jgi:hypothetical protein
MNATSWQWPTWSVPSYLVAPRLPRWDTAPLFQSYMTAELFRHDHALLVSAPVQATLDVVPQGLYL